MNASERWLRLGVLTHRLTGLLTHSKPMHPYLNNLLCSAAPCDGELQDAIEHAIVTGAFNPTGNLLADHETIGRESGVWRAAWRRRVEANTTQLLAAAGPLLTAAGLNRAA